MKGFSGCRLLKRNSCTQGSVLRLVPCVTSSREYRIKLLNVSIELGSGLFWMRNLTKAETGQLGFLCTSCNTDSFYFLIYHKHIFADVNNEPKQIKTAISFEHYYAESTKRKGFHSMFVMKIICIIIHLLKKSTEGDSAVS